MSILRVNGQDSRQKGQFADILRKQNYHGKKRLQDKKHRYIIRALQTKRAKQPGLE